MESRVKCNVQKGEGLGVQSDILNVDFLHGKNFSFDNFALKLLKVNLKYVKIWQMDKL